MFIKMNNKSKDQIARDMVCKSHSARTERELYRICPSKLSKRELEDLYFALLENNLDLKRTVNSQSEKIKEINTQLQRMTASQKSNFSRDQRECCVSIKAAYNDQKEIIADLKRAKERMAERIKLLNMRLCSAKQFLKRNSAQGTPRHNKSSLATITSFRNASITTLNMKASASNLKSAAISTQTINNESVSIDYIENAKASKENRNDNASTVTNKEKAGEASSMKAVSLERDPPERVCEENKCRTAMEELKQKILHLELELSNCHEEYRRRIGKLEGEARALRADKLLSNSDELDMKVDQLSADLREANAKNRDLATKLRIEKRRVVELGTRLKAAQVSSRVVATIKEHLARISDNDTTVQESLCTCQAVRGSSTPKQPSNVITTPVLQIADATVDANCPHKEMTSKETVPIQQSNHTVDNNSVNNVDSKLKPTDAKDLDDSGYVDGNKVNDMEDDKIVNKFNQELMDRISQLQTQLEYIKSPEAHQDYFIDSTIQGYDNESLPTILQQSSPHKRSLHDDRPLQSWDKTTDKFPVVLPSTSKKCAEESKISTGISSSVKQIQGNIVTENQLKQDFLKPLSNKGENVGKGHKESIFGQQDYDENTRPSKELTVNETMVQNELGETILKSSKFNKLSFEDETDKVNFPRNKPTALSTTFENISIKNGTNDSINIHKLMLANKYLENKVATAEELKHGTNETIHSPVVNDSSGYDNYREDGNKPKVLAQSADEVEVNDSKCVTTELRSILTDKRPVIPSEQNIGHVFVDSISNANISLTKPDCDASHQGIKVTGTSTIDQNTQCQIKEFGAQVATDNFGEYAPYRGSPGNDRTQTYIIPQNGEEKLKSHDRDTDCEISELTDLSTEEDDKSPRQLLSPGEQKTTTTTNSLSGLTTDLGSLSEGELPVLSRPRKLSEGEKPCNIQQVPQQTSGEQMQSTLQAITEDLAKCEQLLLLHRKQQREVPL